MDRVPPRGSGPGGSEPPADDQTSLVRTIGRYHLVDELGRGAMGVVYKGFDPIIGRTVALKTIAFSENDTEARELRARLYREAGAAGTLSHPNIVTIYDVLEEGGTSAVAMEFIEGRTLADVIVERSPLPISEALQLFEQVCSALDYAGSKGIVHRDVKPANIMVTPGNVAKVADFGVARMGMSTMTQHGVIVGSPAYMSPEQIRGQQLDGRSDLFSATVVFYELLTGSRPFSGDDLAATMYRIIHEPPIPVTEINKSLGAAVNAVFEMGLAKDRDHRFRTGKELCAAFRDASLPRAGGMAFATDATSAIPVPQVGTKTASQPATSSMPAPVVATPEKGGRPLVAGLLGGFLAVGIGVGVMMWAGGFGPGASQNTAAPQETGASQPAPNAAAGSTPAPTAGATGAAPAANPSAAAPPPAPALPAAPESPVAPTATVQVQFDGDAFPVAISADGKQVGRAERAGERLRVPTGSVRLRASSDRAFFSRDFGSVRLGDGDRHVITMPATTSASIRVAGDEYQGLQITINGFRVPGAYPFQLPNVAVGQHRIQFRWTSGALSGTDLSQTISLDPGGRVYQILANPADGKVDVRKLR